MHIKGILYKYLYWVQSSKSCQNSDTIIEKSDTKKELAKIAGVSHDTINKVELIEKNADGDIKEAVRSGKTSLTWERHTEAI